MSDAGLPAWASAFDSTSPTKALPLPAPAAAWAWDGATGAGVKVAVIDSGVDESHPQVGRLAGAVAIEPDADAEGGTRVVEGPHEDLFGHGTACAAIIRRLAPEAEIYSVRVLGANLKAKGATFYAGIRWALDAGMDVVNMSLSSSSDEWFAALHEIADEAYYRNTLLVCAANNRPGRRTRRSTRR